MPRLVPLRAPFVLWGVCPLCGAGCAPQAGPRAPGAEDRASPAAQGPLGGEAPASGNPGDAQTAVARRCHGCFAFSCDSPARSRRPCLRRCSPFRAALWVSFLFSLFLFFFPQVPRAGDSAPGFIQKSLRASDPREASQCLDVLE